MYGYFNEILSELRNYDINIFYLPKEGGFVSYNLDHLKSLFF